MKKMMIATVVAVAMSMGVYAEEAAPKCDAKAEAKCGMKACTECVKLNEGAAKDAVKKLCPACQKAADEAAKKAAPAAAK